jgi:putative endopeptidase
MPPPEPGGDVVAASGDADPCSDFASYACGSQRVNGSRMAPRPGDMLARRQQNEARFIAELVGRRRDDGDRETAILRDYYARCDNAKARDASTPELQAQLAELAHVATLEDLARVLGHLRAVGFAILVDFWAARNPDPASPAPVAALGLNSSIIPRLVYGNSAALVGLFVQHWRDLAALSGVVAASEADAAYRIDLTLARLEPASADADDDASASRSYEELRRPTLFPWRTYLSAAGLSDTVPLTVARSRDLESVDYLARLPLSDLKSFVRVALLHEEQLYLGRDFLEEHHRLMARVTGHAPWTVVEVVCPNLLAVTLEPLLADAYLSSLADPRSEETARRMFAALRARLSRRVQAAQWLDGGTRQRAAGALASVELRLVGDLESHFLDGTALPAGSFLGLELAIRRARVGLSLARLAGSDVALEPTFDPAHFDLRSNIIWVSPEMVRPPYVRAGTFNSLSFGALGAVLGHELGHVLSLATKDAHAPCVERRLAGGRFAAERVADIAGVQLALAEMEAELGERRRDRDSWREEFFLAYAQQLCAYESDKHLDDDPHPPLGPRINGTLAHVREFAETFRCKPGTPLAPAEPCTIW